MTEININTMNMSSKESSLKEIAERTTQIKRHLHKFNQIMEQIEYDQKLAH